jgi:hypothetical protein
MYSIYMDIAEYSIIAVEMRLLLYGHVFVLLRVYILALNSARNYKYNRNASQFWSEARSSSS